MFAVTLGCLSVLTNTLVIDFHQAFDVEKFLPQFFALFLLCLVIWHLGGGITISISNAMLLNFPFNQTELCFLEGVFERLPDSLSIWRPSWF